MKSILLINLAIAVFMLSACEKNENLPEPVVEQASPEIITITPLEAFPGDEIKITGKNFSTTKDENTVEFTGGKSGVVNAATDTSLLVIIPEGATTGTINVIVNNKSISSVDAINILPALPAPPFPDPVAFYPLDGHAYDASDNDLHGILYGTSTTANRNGEPGRAMNFNNLQDGTVENYVAVPNNGEFANQNFSISFWIQHPENTFSNGYIVNNFNTTENKGFAIRNMSGNPLHLEYLSSNTLGGLTKYITEREKWYHVLVTYDGTTFTRYTNGRKTRVSNENILPSTDSLFFAILNEQDKYLFHGDLDDIAIYDRALSEDDVIAYFQNNAPEEYLPMVNLNLWFPYLEANPRDIDRQVLGKHAMGTDPKSEDRYGNNGDAIAIPSPSYNCLSYSDTEAFDFSSQKFTINIWSKHTAIDNNKTVAILNKTNALGNPNGWFLGAKNGQYIFQTGTSASRISGGTVTTGNFNMITITYDNGVAKLYENGVLQTSKNDMEAIVVNTEPLVVGGPSVYDEAFSGIVRMEGVVDDIFTYRAALSDDQVMALYKFTKPE